MTHQPPFSRIFARKTMLLVMVVAASMLVVVPAGAFAPPQTEPDPPAATSVHPLRQIVSDLSGSSLELPPIDAAVKLDCQPRRTDAQAAASLCEWRAGDDLDIRAWQLWRLQVRPEHGDRTLVATLGADTASYTDAGLATPAKYLYAVLGLDAEGTVIARSRVVSVRFPADEREIDLAPMRLSCERADSESPQIGCHWSAVDHDAVTGYVLWRGVDGGERTVLARVGLDTLAVRDDAVAPGHRYTYVITAVNHDGEVIGRSRSETVGIRQVDRPVRDEPARDGVRHTDRAPQD